MNKEINLAFNVQQLDVAKTFHTVAETLDKTFEYGILKPLSFRSDASFHQELRTTLHLVVNMFNYNHNELEGYPKRRKEEYISLSTYQPQGYANEPLQEFSQSSVSDCCIKNSILDVVVESVRVAETLATKFPLVSKDNPDAFSKSLKEWIGNYFDETKEAPDASLTIQLTLELNGEKGNTLNMKATLAEPLEVGFSVPVETK